MKIVVTHGSPDLDAITSVWLIKRFLPDWHNASVEFVPAGNRSPRSNNSPQTLETVIETISGDEVIHVDTGLGPLDHHQTSDQSVCGASRTWEYVIQNSKFKIQNSDHVLDQKEAIDRMVRIVVDIDHFQEVFWANPTADYHEFSLFGILEGLKFKKPDQDQYYTDVIMECLDALLANFENRIWAEKEIKENSKEFMTRWGKGIGFSTLNDTVLKLVQKMGYVVVVRKDPRKGYVRIKARPDNKQEETKVSPPVDLTPVYDRLKELDPQASWYLHVSKKMLLNGSSKNPAMKPSTLSLNDIIGVLETI